MPITATSTPIWQFCMFCPAKALLIGTKDAKELLMAGGIGKRGQNWMLIHHVSDVVMVPGETKERRIQSIALCILCWNNSCLNQPSKWSVCSVLLKAKTSRRSPKNRHLMLGDDKIYNSRNNGRKCPISATAPKREQVLQHPRSPKKETKKTQILLMYLKMISAV